MIKFILSALAGALAVLAVIIIAATIYANKDQPPKDYEHIDYVSTITEAKCYVCSDSGGYTVSAHWGEDNMGIVNLNTFEMMRLEINRYSERGELIEESAGYMSSIGLSDKEADSYAHAYCFPDNAYASVQITGVQYAIDREAIQSRLCQTCRNSINDL